MVTDSYEEVPTVEYAPQTDYQGQTVYARFGCEDLPSDNVLRDCPAIYILIIPLFNSCLLGISHGRAPIPLLYRRKRCVTFLLSHDGSGG